MQSDIDELIKTEVTSPSPANVIAVLDPSSPPVYHGLTPTSEDVINGIFEVIDHQTTEANNLQLVPKVEAEVVEGNEGQLILNALSNFGNTNMMPQVNTVDGLQPYVEILEQPAPNKLRFRYEVEGRSAGALQGSNSTPQNKTHPKIKIHGYQGPAVVVVSCVEEDPPYKTHPHNLVGKQCIKGVCRVDVSPDMTAVFPNLGIQCVRKRDSADSLAKRQEIKVDPFKQGFAHMSTANVNLNSIRLCFQVFLTGLGGEQPTIGKSNF